MALLHTTFYVFDGAPVSFSVDGRILRLTAHGGATLAYRSYRPDVIDAATAITSAASDFRYFTCVIKQLDAPASGPASIELRQLAAAAHALAPDWIRAAHAALLRRAGHTAEADPLATEDQVRKTFEDMLPILQHPGMRRQEFGAYFDCGAGEDP